MPNLILHKRLSIITIHNEIVRALLIHIYFQIFTKISNKTIFSIKDYFLVKFKDIIILYKFHI